MALLVGVVLKTRCNSLIPSVWRELQRSDGFSRRLHPPFIRRPLDFLGIAVVSSRLDPSGHGPPPEFPSFAFFAGAEVQTDLREPSLSEGLSHPVPAA